jgi:hypothetical protein
LADKFKRFGSILDMKKKGGCNVLNEEKWIIEVED